MKLDREAALLCAAVLTVLLSFATQHLEVTAIATNSQQKVTEYSHHDSKVRVRRQTRYRNKGFFSLIYDYFVETRADTMNAFRNISDLVSKTIVARPQGIQLNTTDPELIHELHDANTTTTEATFLITQEELLRLVRRNVRGLARLFNRESRQAIEDSNKNVQVLRKQLKDAIRPYVQPTNTSNT